MIELTELFFGTFCLLLTFFRILTHRIKASAENPLKMEWNNINTNRMIFICWDISVAISISQYIDCFVLFQANCRMLSYNLLVSGRIKRKKTRRCCSVDVSQETNLCLINSYAFMQFHFFQHSPQIVTLYLIYLFISHFHRS